MYKISSRTSFRSLWIESLDTDYLPQSEAEEKRGCYSLNNLSHTEPTTLRLSSEAEESVCVCVCVWGGGGGREFGT